MTKIKIPIKKKRNERNRKETWNMQEEYEVNRNKQVNTQTDK